MTEEIKINTGNLKLGVSKTFEFLKQKKVLNILLIILFVLLLVGSAWVRLQNVPLLVDQTTGKNIPLALDPFYFLRLAETIVSEGGLPEVDEMRYPAAEVGFNKEVLPYAIVFLYKISSVFDKDVTIQYIDVISPVIFFILGLIIFFFLIYVLTKSKSIAFLSSVFLAIIPTYLYRTLAGFADHESIGMFAFFLMLLCFGISLKFLDKKEYALHHNFKTILFGLLVGFFSAFTIAAWGGIAAFVFMIIPLTFAIFWVIKVQNEESKIRLSKLVLFYITWFFSSIIFTLFYGFTLTATLGKILLGNTSVMTGFVLLFIIIDYFLITKKRKTGYLEKYRVLFSALFAVIVGAIALSAMGKNLFSFIPQILDQLLHPFGTGRVGLTVAENKQPFLNDWIAQIGKRFFWLFYLGMTFVGIELSKGIRKRKNKIFFALLWIIMITGILFSRISASSLFNGTNFISQAVYFGSLLLFFGYSIWLYFKDEIKIRPELILISTWLFLMLVAGRGAIRLFFAITPFACFMISYFTVNLFKYAKKSKDEFSKMILFVASIIVIIILIISSIGFVNSTKQQAKYTGPSAHIQWQNAMSWVRENTPQGSIFVHWWDYGHWVTYLGERKVVTDGGHGVGYWDHLIGRYLLTTPYPETALSFMKTHDVSYLLIDPTDIGKYSAYSGIGSGQDGKDRYAWIPTMISYPDQIQETQNSVIRIYQGGSPLDEDITYNLDGNELFFPAEKAAMAGVMIETKSDQVQLSFSQPQGVFIHNQNQINLPIRYLYFDGQIVDFGEGVEAIVSIIPRVYQTDAGTQIDVLGAAFYLSPKVAHGLFAQLYLLNDPFELYKDVELAYSEPDPTINMLNAQGANLNEFVFFEGIRGPIKIWEVNPSENVLIRDEFLRRSGDYAEFDNLQFTK